MSKTDKTRPWRVRMADAPMVTCVPVHDHRFGPCTLPDKPTADKTSLTRPADGCYWGVPSHYALGCVTRGCGREWHYFLREERRRSRRRARRELRACQAED